MDKKLRPVRQLSQKPADSPEDRRIPVLTPDPAVGLTEDQARARTEAGLYNREIDPPTKTVQQIILSNVCTYFNLVFTAIAVFVAITGEFENLTFMGVVLANTLIGIVQELKSKRTLDKMTVLTSRKCTVIRGGVQMKIGVNDAVRDDIVVFASGDQIFADAEVVCGECLANEALITGEADEIKKFPGECLTSGSFIVAGSCRARLTRVGADSFASRLTIEAKKSKKRGKSEMMNALTKLVKWIGIALIPFAALLYLKESMLLDSTWQDSVIRTSGALIGMIPEGLYLLTSLALVASILRLARKNTLVHEMDCIETLARVDTLCVDKTGTITENKMVVDDTVPLCPDRFSVEDVELLMADYVYAMQADNDTMIALKKYFSNSATQTAERVMPFTSAKKYGGVSFHPDESYVLGAPDVILGSAVADYSRLIDGYLAKGCRVLLLARYYGDMEEAGLPARKLPIALILLSNKIRAEAPETFRFFARQGVDIKVISGDNAAAVSSVARRAGIRGADSYVDARTLDTDEKLTAAATEYTVFGRVTPEQKRKLVRALRKAGRCVAMTGDGVNDVLALKEADCSIAMASGSDVAAQASHIVLLDSDFSAMPAVVAEGRRVINNIERSASLYLSKNIFSFLLALISLIFTLPYPFSPAQLSLVSTLTIGLPSFVLAMEPNESIIRGRFMTNVMYRAMPAGLTNVFMTVGAILFYLGFGFSMDKLSTICALLSCTVGLIMLFVTCRPFNKVRKILFWGILAAMVGAIALLGNTLFGMVTLDFQTVLILGVFMLLSPSAFYAITKAIDKINEKWHEWRDKAE
ncbi:MAG: HAD-IC family P-type ATPase [Clostridia bacterium]|nr:HAD-IC family P-type ATPase [Clostridia bacterium]